MLCLFPMEPPVYARHGVDARFVGHPLADTFAIEPDQAAARSTLGLPPTCRCWPCCRAAGSARLHRLGADFIGAARILAEQIPNLQVVVPMANAACRDAFAGELDARESEMEIRGSGNGARLEHGRSDGRGFESQIPNPRSRPTMLVLDGQSHTAMIAADAVLLASGTAALEAMLAKRPWWSPTASPG